MSRKFNLFLDQLIKSPVLLIFIILLNFFFGLIDQLTLVDPFHKGEWFASATNIFFGDLSAYKAIQIHGLNDVIPALLTQYIWGVNNHFVPTLVFYSLIEFLAYLLLLTALIQLASLHSNRNIFVLIVTTIGGELVGYKDFGLLLVINLYIFLTKNHFTLLYKFVLNILLGVAGGFALFWSFDRGIIGLIAFGSMTLISLKKNIIFLSSIVTFVFAIFSFQLISNIFSVEKYLDNLFLLITTASEWSYEIDLEKISLIGFSLIFNILAYSLYFLNNLRGLKNVYVLCDLVFYGLLAFLILRLTGINRADLHHVYQTYWVPLLILSTVCAPVDFPKFFKNYKESWITILIILSCFVILSPAFGLIPYITLLVVCSLGFSLFGILGKTNLQFLKIIALVIVATTMLHYLYKSVNHGKYSLIMSLSAPPKNAEIATEGVRWSAERLVESEATCIFDLSNNGVINSLAKLPVCTKFTYPVYAGKKNEAILISQLEKTMPSAIVYSSDYWSYSIDGRSMATRFPMLDKFLLANYPLLRCELGYCVRYRIKNSN